MRHKRCVAHFLFATSFLLMGCQQDVVQRRANKLASTVSNLYYEQVLDNLALNISNADSLPFFGVPTQGTHANTRQYQASYTPGWDYVSSIMPHHYLFDKQMLGLTGMVQNQESVQVTPITSPDKLLAMRLVYRLATKQTSPLDRDNDRDKLARFYDTQSKFYTYSNYIEMPNWFCWTTDWKVAKHNRAAGTPVGANNGIYVYVRPGKVNELTLFTMSILDIATLDTDVLYGYKKMKDSNADAVPPRLHYSPVPPPYLAP